MQFKIAIEHNQSFLSVCCLRTQSVAINADLWSSCSAALKELICKEERFWLQKIVFSSLYICYPLFTASLQIEEKLRNRFVVMGSFLLESRFASSFKRSTCPCCCPKENQLFVCEFISLLGPMYIHIEPRSSDLRDL